MRKNAKKRGGSMPSCKRTKNLEENGTFLQRGAAHAMAGWKSGTKSDESTSTTFLNMKGHYF